MARLPRIVRAMIGTGLTFAVGVGAISTIIGSIAVLVGRGSFREILGMAGRFSVVAMILGVAFAGILAIAARSRRLARLSIPRVASLGAGAGLLYFGFLAANGGRHWSLGNAISNLVILTVLGGGSAAGTLMLARRGGAELGPGDEPRSLGHGKSGD